MWAPLFRKAHVTEERLIAYLLLRRQMCIFSASAMSCSRKSGCATAISASARSQVDRPLRLTMPYSVTI